MLAMLNYLQYSMLLRVFYRSSYGCVACHPMELPESGTHDKSHCIDHNCKDKVLLPHHQQSKECWVTSRWEDEPRISMSGMLTSQYFICVKKHWSISHQQGDDRNCERGTCCDQRFSCNYSTLCHKRNQNCVWSVSHNITGSEQKLITKMLHQSSKPQGQHNIKRNSCLHKIKRSSNARTGPECWY